MRLDRRIRCRALVARCLARIRVELAHTIFNRYPLNSTRATYNRSWSSGVILGQHFALVNQGVLRRAPAPPNKRRVIRQNLSSLYGHATRLWSTTVLA